MTSRGLKAICVVLAIVCLAGGVVLAGRAAIEVYADLRTSLQVVCVERGLPPGADTDMSAIADIDAGIGPLPLGVWCTYPAIDGPAIVVPPSFALSGVALASVFLLALGVVVAAIARRMRVPQSG